MLTWGRFSSSVIVSIKITIINNTYSVESELMKRNVKMQKLLMLGTSTGSVEIINRAKQRGVYTVTTDFLPKEKSPAKMVSDEFWMINTGDLAALEKKCREEKITAILSGVSEFNLDQAISLSERLGLRFYCTREAWRFSRDKEAFKRVCHKVGAPVATDYFVSENLTEEELSRIRFPVVVKPVDQCGNAGVSYCYNKDDLRVAYCHAREVSNSPKVIVERMLHGEEWYSMYAIANGEPRLTSLNAMYAQPGEPKNCYTITTTVSNHVDQYIKEINPAIERVLRAVGCTDGIAWVQVMHDEDGHFYILEMGYRLDGEMSVIPCRELCGFDAIDWLLDTALGIDHAVEDLPKSQKEAFVKCACAMDLFTNKGGRVVEVSGFDELSGRAGYFINVHRRVGDLVDKFSTVGVITFSSENCEEMCRKIDEVNKMVHLINEHGEDMIIKYTDFDYLKRVYAEGLVGK